MLRKNSKTTRPYSKSEFKSIVCSNCKLCDNNVNPTFCYSLYKSNPLKFMHYTFVQLCKAYQTELDELKAELLFKTIFCNANICDNEVDNSSECPLLIDCMNEFIKQTLTCNKFMRSKGNSKSYKNNKYIAKAYPTFFCRTGIEKEIKNIIGDKIC